MGAGSGTGFARRRDMVIKPFRRALSWTQMLVIEIFGLGRSAALIAVILTSVILIFAAFWFFHSAPPTTITITSGPVGSMFQRNAEKYAKILARNGVTLKILASEGSVENLTRLADPSFVCDIGLVQGGIAKGANIDRLVSLGSVFYEPLFVFYRNTTALELLSQLKGRRIAVGEVGSGTHALSQALLAANGIEPGGTTVLLEYDSDAAAKEIVNGTIDAAFLMGDSVSTSNIRTLLRTEGVRLFDFNQAEGYTRRIRYLSKLELPKGVIDLGKDIPEHAVTLIAPTVELIAREDLHPALSDLLLEAATEVHGGAGLLQRRGEFPALLEREFRTSPDAARFHTSGKSFLYRYFPFWLASLMNRILVVFVPVIILLIPGLRLIPAIYRWRMKMRIYKWYGALLVLEQDMVSQTTPEQQRDLPARLDAIEQAVNTLHLPASFADQFYGLRVHIGFVRERLRADTPIPTCATPEERDNVPGT